MANVNISYLLIMLDQLILAHFFGRLSFPFHWDWQHWEIYQNGKPRDCCLYFRKKKEKIREHLHRAPVRTSKFCYCPHCSFSYILLLPLWVVAAAPPSAPCTLGKILATHAKNWLCWYSLLKTSVLNEKPLRQEKHFSKSNIKWS